MFSASRPVDRGFCRMEMLLAGIARGKHTPRTGKNKIKVDLTTRGGEEMKKTDGPCEPSARDLIITTICYNSQLPILLCLLSNYF